MPKKYRINEDYVYMCSCNDCAYKTKAWAKQWIENNEVQRLPNIENCPECGKSLEYKLIENLEMSN